MIEHRDTGDENDTEYFGPFTITYERSPAYAPGPPTWEASVRCAYRVERFGPFLSRDRAREAAREYMEQELRKETASSRP